MHFTTSHDCRLYPGTDPVSHRPRESVGPNSEAPSGEQVRNDSQETRRSPVTSHSEHAKSIDGKSFGIDSKDLSATSELSGPDHGLFNGSP